MAAMFWIGVAIACAMVLLIVAYGLISAWASRPQKPKRDEHADNLGIGS